MTIEDLKETAALARLNMDEAELSAAFPAFEQMVRFFTIMQAADTDEAAFGAPLRGPSGAAASPAAGSFRGASAEDTGITRIVDSGVYRPDSAGAGGVFPEDLNEKMVNNAGERDGRFMVIPNVL
ncbi:MAG: aspartyl/glutamyl-tRNA amidotransferase subunit C [Treponema sp.]|jgi:aspartyl-tRNA(Asn)/glutamyl-tRNA(Gln) amidotransferase subunit C|nr:aspartyl/glutamyl-tRNA amidotransferase subunit C [Treponema sp.]